MHMSLSLMQPLVIVGNAFSLEKKRNILATGAAALMAIRVLLDHNVPEEKIAVLSLLVSKQGQSMTLFSFSIHFSSRYSNSCLCFSKSENCHNCM